VPRWSTLGKCEAWMGAKLPSRRNRPEVDNYLSRAPVDNGPDWDDLLHSVVVRPAEFTSIATYLRHVQLMTVKCSPSWTKKIRYLELVLLITLAQPYGMYQQLHDTAWFGSGHQVAVGCNLPIYLFSRSRTGVPPRTFILFLQRDLTMPVEEWRIILNQCQNVPR
jgi:hypothetical protein